MAEKREIILRIVLLDYYYSDGFGWLRVFGIGLLWKNTKKHDLIFSEREGYRKYIMIGKYLIRFLRARKQL